MKKALIAIGFILSLFFTGKSSGVLTTSFITWQLPDDAVAQAVVIILSLLGVFFFGALVALWVEPFFMKIGVMFLGGIALLGSLTVSGINLGAVMIFIFLSIIYLIRVYYIEKNRVHFTFEAARTGQSILVVAVSGIYALQLFHAYDLRLLSFEALVPRDVVETALDLGVQSLSESGNAPKGIPLDELRAQTSLGLEAIMKNIFRQLEPYHAWIAAAGAILSFGILRYFVKLFSFIVLFLLSAFFPILKLVGFVHQKKEKKDVDVVSLD